VHLNEALEIFQHLELDRGLAEVRLQQARFARAERAWSEAMDALELARLALRELTLPQVAAEIDLLEAEIQLDRQDPIAAGKAAKAARARFRDTGQDVLGARAALAEAEAAAAVGDSAAAEEGFRQALDVLGERGAGANLADAQQRYGLHLLRSGSVDPGLALLQQAVDWMEQQQRCDLVAETLNLQGAVLTGIGELDQALGSFSGSEAAAEQCEDGPKTQIARSNRINLLAQMGRWEEALALAGPDPPDELVELVGLGRARAAFEKGLAAMEAEQWDEATTWMEEALALVAPGDRTLRRPARANLRMIEHHRGQTAQEQGDLPTAMAHLEAALEHAAYEENPSAEAQVLKDLAMVRFALQDIDGALAFLDQALPAANAAREDDLIRLVYFQRGLVGMETDGERARADLESSLAIEPDARDELAAAARYNLGIVLFRAGDLDGSRQTLEESRVLYDELGLAAQVQQIEGYLEDFPAEEDG